MPLGMPSVPLRSPGRSPSAPAAPRTPSSPMSPQSRTPMGGQPARPVMPSIPRVPMGGGGGQSGGGQSPWNAGGARMEGNTITPHPNDPRGRTTTPAAPTPGFTPTPEYSNQGAWSGWGGSAPQYMSSFVDGVAGESVNFLTGGAIDNRMTVEQAYTEKYGAEAVAQAKKSGLDPATFFALAPKAQQIAAQWGTNLGSAGDIRAQQQAAYDSNQAQIGQTNDLIDQFGTLQDMQYSNLGNQYASGTGMATARYDLGMTQLKDGLGIDLGMLGEQKYRNVDLAQQDNAAQMDYIRKMMGFTNQGAQNAYARFGSNDQYMAGQAQDLLAQYGFNTRNRDQEMEAAFAERGTQRRGATSDAAARGAFGSAGFGDNIADIQGGYERSVARTDLGFDQANQQLDERGRAIGNNRANLRFGYNDEARGFDERKAGLQRDASKTANADAGLKSLGREYGLKEADIRNQFKNASTALGLDYNDTMQKLEQMMSSGNADLYAQGMQFMQQMMAYQ